VINHRPQAPWKDLRKYRLNGQFERHNHGGDVHADGRTEFSKRDRERVCAGPALSAWAPMRPIRTAGLHEASRGRTHRP